MRRDSLALLATLGLFTTGAFVACGSDDDTPPPATKTIKPKPTGTGTTTSTPTGSSSNPNPTDPPATLTAFAQQYPSAYCAAATPCCKDKGSSTDQAGCEKATFQQLALVQDSSDYDATRGKACISALKDLAGKSEACATLDKGIDDCLKAITPKGTTPGGTAPGGACTSSEECAPPPSGDVRCEEVGFGADAKKICQHVLDGADGSTPCVGDARQTLTVNEDAKLAVGTVYRCKEGLTCDASSRVCKAATALGGACFASYECTTNTYCAGGKCAATLADGAACTEDDECGATSFCSSQSKCLAYVAAGGTCTGEADSRCLDGACVNGKCPGGDTGSALVCY